MWCTRHERGSSAIHARLTARRAGDIDLTSDPDLAASGTGFTVRVNAGLSRMWTGEMNGDGIVDYVIGVPGANSGRGAVHVFVRNNTNDIGACLWPTSSPKA